MIRRRRKESGIKGKLIEYAHSRGWEAGYFVSVGRRGEGDIWMRRGPPAEFRVLEVKESGEEASKLQERRLAAWRTAGFKADWVDSYEEGRVFIDF